MSNKSQGEQQPAQCADDFDRKKSLVITATPSRISRLRQAYLDGQLRVDSRRLAKKILAFERQLAMPEPDQDRSGDD